MDDGNLPVRVNLEPKSGIVAGLGKVFAFRTGIFVWLFPEAREFSTHVLDGRTWTNAFNELYAATISD